MKYIKKKIIYPSCSYSFFFSTNQPNQISKHGLIITNTAIILDYKYVIWRKVYTLCDEQQIDPVKFDIKLGSSQLTHRVAQSIKLIFSGSCLFLKSLFKIGLLHNHIQFELFLSSLSFQINLEQAIAQPMTYQNFKQLKIRPIKACSRLTCLIKMLHLNMF